MLALKNLWANEANHPKQFNGHFRVSPSLSFKARRSKKPLIKINDVFIPTQINSLSQGFALSLVLKVGVFGARKWLIKSVFEC